MIKMELQMSIPNHSIGMEQEEMMYLDGGIYFGNGTIKGIMVAIGANYGSVVATTTAMKVYAALTISKLAGAFGPIVWAIGGAVGACFVTQEWTVGEGFVRTIVQNRAGCHINRYLACRVIPSLEASLSNYMNICQ